MAIDFSIDPEDLKQALKPFFAGKARGKDAELEYVDVKAQNGEIEFVSTAIGATIPCEVVSAGRGRIPFRLFEALFRRPQRSTDSRLSIKIGEGQVKVETMIVTNAEITVLLNKARIADLPLDAPLLEVLALTLRFNHDELADSGLSDRVAAAQRRTDDLVERASKLLEPLGITLTELDQFVAEQIRKRAAK